MKQAVELEDLGFELSAFSVEEVRFLNLNCVSFIGVARLGGIYCGVTYLKGV
jgi:hypothetical protein